MHPIPEEEVIGWIGWIGIIDSYPSVHLAGTSSWTAVISALVHPKGIRPGMLG